MRTRISLTLFLLSILLMAACAQGTPTPAPIPTGSSVSRPQPSPSALIPAPATADPGPIPSTIDSTTTVAVEVAPGWTRYESINYVRALAFAADGGLWASTDGGLVRWDLDTATYTRYLLQADQIAVAPDGTLWLDTAYGLCRFDGMACELTPEMPESMAGGIFALAMAPTGEVWAGGESGASRLDWGSWTGYPLGVGVYGLAVSANGEVWAATSAGVGRYDRAEDRWTFDTQEQGLPAGQVMALGVGPGDEVWVYVIWEGLFRLYGEEWQPVENPPGGDVRAIAFAADGVPWVGTVGGTHYPGGSLSSWDGEGWVDVSSGTGLISFRTVAPGPGGMVAAATNLGLGVYERGEWRMLRDGPTSSHVMTVAVTPDGAVWFAFGDESLSTNGSGLSRFDGQRWDYHLGDAEVGALAVAPDGSLWAGVGTSIQRFDGGAWETLARSGEELPMGNVLDVEFAADGSAWAATGLGLARFDGQAWVSYDRLVHAVVAAPDGAIWVNGWDGTQGSQYIARFDGEEWETFYAADSAPGAFSLSAVTSDGRVWGIVPERGLAAFDGQSWAEASSWAFYSPSDGLVLWGTWPTVAPDGALWMRFQEDVARFDPSLMGAEAWTVYEDILEGGGAPIAFGPDGEVWFGATRFEPAGAEGSSPAP